MFQKIPKFINLLQLQLKMIIFLLKCVLVTNVMSRNVIFVKHRLITINSFTYLSVNIVVSDQKALAKTE